MPGLGQNVHYRLSRLDADIITDRRRRAELAALNPPHVIGPSGTTVAEGDLFPAVVVRVPSLDRDAEISLQVILDGNDQHWAQYVAPGNTAGTWCWPDL